MLTIFAMFVVRMCALVLNKQIFTFFSLSREAAQTFHMWRVDTFGWVLSITIFLLFHLGFLLLLFLFSPHQTMNAHPLLAVVALRCSEVHKLFCYKQIII